MVKLGSQILSVGLQRYTALRVHEHHVYKSQKLKSSQGRVRSTVHISHN